MFVYLSGPITPVGAFTIRDNVDAAVGVYLQLIADGICAFCPHLSALVPEAFDVPYERWMQYDFDIIDHCTHLLMLDRWEGSNGARREREYAERLGKPVFYSLEELYAAAKIV